MKIQLRFDPVTALLLCQVIWAVFLCRVCTSWHFEGACFLIKCGAAHPVTHCHIPGDLSLQDCHLLVSYSCHMFSTAVMIL